MQNQMKSKKNIKRGNKNQKINNLGFTLFSYAIIFVGISFILTCSLMLFLSGSGISEEFVRQRAPQTFGNIFILSFVFTYITIGVKHIYFDKHLSKLLEGTSAVIKGDYTIRLYDDVNRDRQDFIENLAYNFNEIVQLLKKTENLQQDFISNVSHEIKTPLAVIKNYIQLLETSNLSEDERKKYYRIIDENVVRLNDLVGNILKLNKLENQKILKENQIFDFGEMVCEAILGYEHIWTEKNIEIETNIEEGLVINSDKRLLEIVCSNLFSNALKFTEPGGKVSVSCYKEGKKFTVSVADTGCGISTETGKRIFEKFYQGDTSRKSEGNGLGLALVKKIIDVLGGEISVQSQLGKGSVFTVKLEGDK